MTDLERVREALEFDGYDEGVALLDAHLKEDAVQESIYEVRMEKMQAELAELKEAVRHFLSGPTNHMAKRLRQLIEEKP